MTGQLGAVLNEMDAAVARHPLRAVSGRVAGVLGGGLRTTLPGLTIGDVCELESADGAPHATAQVIALDRDGASLAVLGSTAGLSVATRVVPRWRPLEFRCGDGLLGRVLDGLGRPLDGEGLPAGLGRRSIDPRHVHPLSRSLVERAVLTGIRAVDGLVTIGAGQRVGVFGPSGAGKTSFIGALARNFSCDVCVLGLVGERGREVREFLDRQLPAEFRARAVVVTATSDRPAMERVTAAQVAASVAEEFRAQGKHVLLVIDSLTRYARALREVGLAAGEPAVRRGFPPSVYAELPRLIERGGTDGKGAITAVYTVLSESEDDPIVEEVKSLTDGHIHLSTALAQAGHYPAIDVLKSQSRLMNEIVSPDHAALARRVRGLMAKYAEVELLIQVGEYRRGQDRFGDEAVDKREAIQSFLRQGPRDKIGAAPMLSDLSRLGTAPKP